VTLAQRWHLVGSKSGTDRDPTEISGSRSGPNCIDKISDQVSHTRSVGSKGVPGGSGLGHLLLRSDRFCLIKEPADLSGTDINCNGHVLWDVIKSGDPVTLQFTI